MLKAAGLIAAVIATEFFLAPAQIALDWLAAAGTAATFKKIFNLCSMGSVVYMKRHNGS
jgi:hypothetical protein